MGSPCNNAIIFLVSICNQLSDYMHALTLIDCRASSEASSSQQEERENNNLHLMWPYFESVSSETVEFQKFWSWRVSYIHACIASFIVCISEVVHVRGASYICGWNLLSIWTYIDTACTLKLWCIYIIDVCWIYQHAYTLLCGWFLLINALISSTYSPGNYSYNLTINRTSHFIHAQ